jgi:hypothetical protein
VLTVSAAASGVPPRARGEAVVLRCPPEAVLRLEDDA